MEREITINFGIDLDNLPNERRSLMFDDLIRDYETHGQKVKYVTWGPNIGEGRQAIVTLES